jgi:class 3 adenylate cyclase
MARSQRERKITVILAADVVGFSRMMGEDEQKTLRNLQDCRKITDSLIKKHRGRVFGSAGDSVIAELPSAVAAVRCARDIQDAFAARNAKMPESEGMWFRVGVNLGDVLVEGDNLFGDGINIAARLETMAEPGGICISGAVFNLVGSKLDLNYEYLGTKKLKNISEPVPVYKMVARTGDEVSEDVETPIEPEPEFYRWTGAASLAVIIAVIAIAIWTYASK